LADVHGVFCTRLEVHHHVAAQEFRPKNARNLHFALKHLHAQRALVQVRPEPSLLVRCKRHRTATDLDLIDIIVFRGEFERGIALLKGHAIDLSPVGRKLELIKIQFGEFPQARG
jgi:hypothetical protein